MNGRTMSPKRIQLRRTKGWRKPEDCIVVARPSRWGNPFVPSNEGHQFWYVTGWGRRFGCLASRDEAVELAVALFRNVYARRGEFGLADPVELAGHDLACWCPLDQPCHADVLLELANP